MHRDEQRSAMMKHFAQQMRLRFGPARWAAVVGKTEQQEQVALLSWQAEFRRRGMNWKDVQAVIQHCTSENCPWPTQVDFFGVHEQLRANAMGHASFRPMDEVMADTFPAPPASEVERERRRATGRKALDALRASF